MLSFLKKLFGGNSEQLKEAIANGAMLIDVRTPGEFSGGSIKGAKNIPLDKIKSHVGKLKGKGTVVVFCQSGMRSASAKQILLNNGVEDVINGGSIYSVSKCV